MRCQNPFSANGVWLKANLHTHTTHSDGDQAPQQRVEQYARAGYDVLAITDHRMVTATAALDGDEMVLIQSLEAHPPCPDGPVYHLVCLNVSEGLDCIQTASANECIARVKADGGEVIAAHPYWCGHTVQHLLALEGIIGMEVYNATCSKIGKADSATVWDYLLATGRCLPAIAVDDTHRGRDIFMGWTMIRAQNRTVPAIMQALRTGCYYATAGPLFHDFTVGENGLSVRCDPVREIHFLCRGAAGRSIYSDDGESLTAAEYEPAASAGYVRVQITDRKGRCAWLNPVVR